VMMDITSWDNTGEIPVGSPVFKEWAWLLCAGCERAFEYFMSEFVRKPGEAYKE